MKHPQSAPHNGGSGVELYELVSQLWRGRLIIVAFAGIFAVVATVVVMLLPDVYRAEALLSPNSNQGGQGIGSLTNRYGGLASLAGLDLAPAQVDKTKLGLEVLKSRKFLFDFIQRHDIAPHLLAVDGWDRESDKLVFDDSIYDEKAGDWLSTSGSIEPSMMRAYEEMTEALFVTEDDRTGLIRVAVEHYSPNVARQWVDWLIADLNQTMRQEDIAKSEQAISFLQQQIAETAVADLRESFFRLIEEQMQTKMLASVSAEYLFETIDPAVAPEEHHRPNRLLLVFLAGLFGLFLASLFVLIRVNVYADADLENKPS